jgi:hypothetical protein
MLPMHLVCYPGSVESEQETIKHCPASTSTSGDLGFRAFSASMVPFVSKDTCRNHNGRSWCLGSCRPWSSKEVQGHSHRTRIHTGTQTIIRYCCCSKNQVEHILICKRQTSVFTRQILRSYYLDGSGIEHPENDPVGVDI